MLNPSPRFRSIATATFRRPVRLIPANDNPAQAIGQDLPLATALRLFAAHGLSAASQAGRAAREAAELGDECGFAHWISVCRALDRKMAREIEKRRANGRL